MSDFDLTGELSLKSELHMLRPITEKVHSGNGPVSLVYCTAVRPTQSMRFLNSTQFTLIDIAETL